MNDRSQIFGFRIAAVLGPVIGVGVFQFVQHDPATANAGMSKPDFQSLPSVPLGLGKVIPASQGEEVATSPFWFEEVQMLQPEMPQFDYAVSSVDEPDPIFILSSVLPTKSKSFAVINGKPHSQGDEIEPGWKLVKISGKDRYIVVEHTSGRRLRIKMNRN
jgi:hypothetical protein